MKDIYSDVESESEYLRKSQIYQEFINRFPASTLMSDFPAFVERRNITKFLSLYEAFKLTVHIPGNVLELGVHNGYNFFTLLHLINTFHPTDRLVRLVGFDTFEGYSADPASPTEYKLVSEFNKGVKREAFEQARSIASMHEHLAPLSGIKRTSLIKGDVRHTLPMFLSEHIGVRFKFVSCDLNTYDSTLKSLTTLRDFVSVGGVIIFYAYGQPGWSETAAVDEFLSEYKNSFEVLPLSPEFPQPRLIVRKVQ